MGFSISSKKKTIFVVAQMIECLPSKCKALSSNSSMGKKKKSQIIIADNVDRILVGIAFRYYWTFSYTVFQSTSTVLSFVVSSLISLAML
jgi:hypothetical protein